MDIKIARTNINEAQELYAIQKQAFQSDLERYSDYKTNPAAETMNSFLQRIIFSYHYTIYIHDKVAGSIDIRRISDDHFVVNQICLNPDRQNQGYGSKIMKMIEEMFPNVKNWSLKTQKDNEKNRHFYEKAGYTLTGEQKMNHLLTLVDYEKRIR
ncbi:GNAT family N-acetyltransferase [Heyndrickxia camelliae]|nr:GNAT family N-acetyltransferase [Heyndrickxia camelliae]